MLQQFVLGFVLVAVLSLAAPIKNYGYHSSGRLEDDEFYSLEFDSLTGENGPVDFSQFRDKVVLITNVASECGYTQMNYKQLRELTSKYGDDLAVVLIPSNDFGAQEPGSEEKIADFIRQQGGDSYVVLQKAAMNGPEQHPLIEMLKQATNSQHRDIKWNFETKFIISPDGTRVSRYSEAFEPLRLVESVEYYVRNKRAEL